jgi:hypothetical protein
MSLQGAVQGHSHRHLQGQWSPRKGKETSGTPGTLLFLFLISLFLSHVSDPCPLAYKREREDPRRGD